MTLATFSEHLPESGWIDLPAAGPVLPLVGQAAAFEYLGECAHTKGPCVCIVEGPAGIGKTRLVEEVTRASMMRWFGIDTQRYEPTALATLVKRLPPDTGVLILDDVDGDMPNAAVSCAQDAGMTVFVTSRRQWVPTRGFPLNDRDAETLRLGRPPDEALMTLAESVGANIREAESLILKTEGNPGHLIAALLDAGGTGSLFGMHPAVNAIVSPDGHPLPAGSVSLRVVETVVRGISDDLITRLAEAPRDMLDLDWRRFEELVADLYRRDGYEVELTRGSRDKGVDIYAVHRTPTARFVTVIDCKRYREGRPVGIELVRQMRSVVADQKAHLGILATTSSFTKGAKEYERQHQHMLGLRDFLAIHEMLKRLRSD